MRLSLVVTRIHKRVLVLAAFGLIMWTCSGLLHTAMSQFGVQQRVLRPPELKLNSVQSLDLSLLGQGVLKDSAVNAIRTVATANVAAVQVTLPNQAERLYFDVQNLRPMPNQDFAQAEFLMRHYFKLHDDTPLNVQLITSFDEDYPSVNRLLPVYKVDVLKPSPDAGLTAYLYTETSAVASVSDPIKRSLQRAFQWLHTWSFLPVELEGARVAGMTVFLLCILCMAGSGVGLLMTRRMPQRRRVHRAQRVHRWVAVLVALPVLAFASSGIFHLMWMAYPLDASNLRLAPPMRFKGDETWASLDLNALRQGTDLQSISVVELRNGEKLYRLQMPARFTENGIPILPADIRNARFAGLVPSGPAVYLSAVDAKPHALGDREVALDLLSQHVGQDISEPDQMRLINRFGGDYDFRNKRLPVWRVDMSSTLGKIYFIDTHTGVLADITNQNDGLERWTFNTLHKWNFLSSLGKVVQNGAIAVTTLLIALGSVGLGLWMRFARRK